MLQYLRCENIANVAIDVPGTLVRWWDTRIHTRIGGALSVGPTPMGRTHTKSLSVNFITHTMTVNAKLGARWWDAHITDIEASVGQR